MEAVGSDVTSVAPGDHVVLFYNSCGACPSCDDNAPFYCHDFIASNMGGGRAEGTPTLTENNGPVFGNFFGQSSFATFALVNERNCIKVREDA